MASTHNIRRPAVWLVLTCLAAIGFFLLTDPRAGLVSYSTGDGAVNAVDAANRAFWGTTVGLVGSGLLLCVALFMCTRKGSPPTVEGGKSPSV